MKTIKDVSEITGISIRTLRYYDEIGLLKPTELTEAGYRLYDSKALEKLQEIMFFRELEIPLMDIKKIMDNPNYDKEQVLLSQKSLLEQKRNRLNGIMRLPCPIPSFFLTFITFNDIFTTVTVIRANSLNRLGSQPALNQFRLTAVIRRRDINERACKRRRINRGDILYSTIPLYPKTWLCGHAVY